MIDHQLLKTELQSDPQAVGYQALLAAGKHADVAAALNARTGKGAEAVTDREVSSADVLEAIDPAEVVAMSSGELALLTLLLARSTVVLRSKTRDTLAGLFPEEARPISRAAITALFTRPGSRAEKLFGAGTVVTNRDIAGALKA